MIDARQQTLSSFDYQWSRLPSGDFMPGDAWFDANATRVLAHELCAIAPEWFRGRRVLDAGCGQGRWTRALLDLGATVTAVDFSEAGLARTRENCRQHPALVTRRVDLLNIPPDLARERFDLVFSFGVLHHTGNTWRALDNVASLATPTGAVFLYLYGAESWDPAERTTVETTRRELAALTFDAKVEVLRRRYPSQDPHQMFDLLSPIVNDRVGFEEVRSRLRPLGFENVTRTIASSEIYLRATRDAFPREALLDPVGAASEFTRESTLRGLRRAGAGFDAELRRATSDVPRRLTPGVGEAIRPVVAGARVLDLSLPADRVSHGDVPGARQLDAWDAGSPAEPGRLVTHDGSVLLWLGTSLGACRYPAELLIDLWSRVERGGALVLELPVVANLKERRSLFDRLLDARQPVPEKLARLLTRRRDWSSGEGLHAIAGATLLHPLAPEVAAPMLQSRGAQVETRHLRPESALLIARHAA